jgi:hypothetical protein
MIPLRRMKHLALERLCTWHIALLRHRQRPDSRYQNLRSPGGFLLSLQVQHRNDPHFVAIIPLRLLNNRVKPNVLNNAILFSDRAEILLDLGTHRVFAAPIWVQREAIRVEMGCDVAATTRICVCQPCSANVVALLNEFEIPEAKFADNLDCEAEAAHAGADDEDFGVERHLGVLSQVRDLGEGCCTTGRLKRSRMT